MQYPRAIFQAIVSVALLSSALALIPLQAPPAEAAGLTNDGVIAYGEAANTTPRFRTYNDNTNTFAAEAGTVAGATGLTFMTRTSPTKQEAIAGYVNSAGTLQVMCFDGTTWTNEWSVAVGGTGTTRRFDISYETNSGDVIVLYSTNVATTNELAFRTKAGSTGCGSANWASATNFNPTRTSGIVQWVKMAWDKRSSSDLITAIWADANSDLSAAVWSGSAWGNEPSAASETSLEVKTAAQDIDDFDVEYESASGDVMMVWANSNGTNGINGVRYRTCTGGTSACTWNAVTTPPTFADDAHELDLAAHPTSDEMVFASIGDSGNDLQIGYWSGSAWTDTANADTSAEGPLVGEKAVAVGWLVAGATSRSVVVYNDSNASTTAWFVGNGSAFTQQTAFSQSPAYATPQTRFEIDPDPLNRDRLMFTASDSANDLFAKRLTMTATPAFTWTNSDGSAALENSLPANVPSDFSFAYWRYLPLVQNSYRWYQNTNAVQPTTPLANENTALNLTSARGAIRLRMNTSLAARGFAASSQRLSLQYSTSTSGPWSSVGSAVPWWNASWNSRRTITFNNSASSTDLDNIAVLITLTSSNVDYAKTQNAGQDIRFVDADGTTALSYEIEKWDESGTSYVWVKVPRINAASNTDNIFMYYENAGASDGQSASNVFDSSTKMVQHLEETAACATTYTDSTSNANNGSCGDAPAAVTGKIAGARSFDGVNDYVSVPDSATLSPTSQMTLSGWVNQSSLGVDKAIAAKWDYGGLNGTWAIQSSSSDSSRLRVFIANASNDSGTNYAETPVSSWTTGWHHVAFTYDGAGSGNSGKLKVYIDGVAQTLTFTGTIASSLTDTTAALRIGDFQGRSRFWNGSIDEVTVDNTARSADWVKGRFLSTNNSLAAVSPEIVQTNVAWTWFNNAGPADGANVTAGLLTGSNVTQSYAESNPTALNPNSVIAGQVPEWDFSLDGTAAMVGTTYYFRLVNTAGAALESYTNYPQVTYGVTWDQSVYRWYTNADAVQPGSALAAENTSYRLPASPVAIRLRIQLSIGANPISTSQAFSLQHATSTSGPWTTAQSGGTNAWNYKQNASVSPGAAITSGLLTGTDATQTYQDRDPSPVNRNTISASQQGEWDFALNPNVIAPGVTYYFRVVKADGSALDTYTQYPTLLPAYPPDAPTSLAQTKTDTTVIGTGNWTNESSVRFTATATDQDNPDTLKLCIEAQPLGTPFTDTETSCGSGFAYSGSGITVTHTLTGLSNNTQYHWQARIKDNPGNYSAWVKYGGNAESASDFGIDTTAPTGGTVYDGTNAGVDAGYNDGSLSSLSANWSGIDSSTSGLLRYEYSIGTTAGGTQVKGWTNNSTTTSVTATSLSLRTNTTYYFNVRALDNAGNTQGTVSSNGQMVAPTLTFVVDPNTQANMVSVPNAGFFTDVQNVTLTTSTNAYDGYVIRASATGLAHSAGPRVISAFNGGTYASPDSWQSGDTGLGYTSSDTTIQGVNKFQAPTCPGGSALSGQGCFAPFTNTLPGDIVADHTAPTVGSPIVNEVFNLTYRTTLGALQPAGRYRTNIVITCTALY